MSLFSYSFITNSLIAGVILGIIMPIVGFILVLRRSAFIADTTAHISLNGLIVGRLLLINSNIISLFFALLTSFVIEYIRQKRKSPSDSILAILLTFGLALTLILISLFKGINFSITSLLFGSILTLTVNDIIFLTIISIIIISIFIKFYKDIFLTIFDEEIAYTKGVKTKSVGYIIAFLTAIVVGVSLQFVGSVLISGLIAIPVNAALQYKKDYKKTIFIAIFIGIIMNISGILFSILLKLPASASIIFSGLIILGVSYLINGFN